MKLRSILERDSTNGIFDDYDQSEEEEEIDDPSIISQAISFIESEHVSIIKKNKKNKRRKKMGDDERETTNENQKDEEEEEVEGYQIQKLIGLFLSFPEFFNIYMMRS